MNPKVSVIVPVYNVEKYLAKCLDSLVHQTLKEIEIIIVNDSTKDNSQDIIDSYKTQFPSIVQSFIKENGGVGEARNFGLKHARGEYIGFIDSDDYVELDMYEKMYDLARKNDSDLVVCDLEYLWETSGETRVMKGFVQKINQPIDRSIYLSPLFAWNKLYRRQLLLDNQIFFPKGLWYEDIPVVVPLFSIAKNISYVDKVMIHYLQHESSIMGSKTNPKMFDIFTSMAIVYDFYKERNLLEEYYEEVEYLYIEHFMLYGSFRFYRSSDYHSLMTKAFEEIKGKFPKWKHNPYLRAMKWSYRLYLYALSPLSYPIFKFLVSLKDERKHA